MRLSGSAALVRAFCTVVASSFYVIASTGHASGQAMAEYRGRIECSSANAQIFAFDVEGRRQGDSLVISGPAAGVPPTSIRFVDGKGAGMLDLNEPMKRLASRIWSATFASVMASETDAGIVLRHESGAIPCWGAMARSTSVAANDAPKVQAPPRPPAPPAASTAATPPSGSEMHQAEYERQLAEARARVAAEGKAREESERKARAEAEQLQKLLAEARAREEAASRAPPAAPAPSADALELAFWDAIKNSSDPNDYKAYLEAYPNGRFAPLARVRAQPRATASTAQPGAGTQLAAAPARPAPPPELSIDYGRYYAVVIGNNAYRELPKLETAVADARAVAELLHGAYEFETQLIENASRGQVLGALTAMRARLKASDNLLIYYAGHGYLDKAVDQGYWLPVDAQRDNPANWIANTDVTVAIRGLAAKHVLIVADSCYSGTLLRAASVGLLRSVPERLEWLKRVAAKKARVVLSSGGVEPVVDGGGGGHSVFAKAFLDALRENQSVLDAQTLFTQIKRPIALNSPQTPEYADIRQAGHDGGDFLFVRRR
jgi:uncharacterized caspase-like protein